MAAQNGLMWAAKRQLLLATLRKHGGNKKATAQELGIGRQTLYNWLAVAEGQTREPTVAAPSEELSLYERLKILRELVPKSGNQGSWSTCLWSVARRDKRLRRDGKARRGRDRRPSSAGGAGMITTRFTEVFGIAHPIVQTGTRRS